MIKVGIVGGTGYTGVELLRILVNHPEVELKVITSRSEEGMPVADMYPNLRGHTDLRFTVPDTATLGECDVVFFATPHGVAHSMAEEILSTGARVIDLSADFRIKDVPTWEKWYGQPHGAPEVLKQAVYGLPETSREAIKSAKLIAAPGCYPTSVQLGYLPLLENNLLPDQMLIADCKSGVSGAGRGAKVSSLLCETSESFSAYGVAGHRHLPEIVQELERAANKAVNLTFVPHLTPMIRGIHSTLYAQAPGLDVDLQALYEARYANEPFVDVMPAGSHPATRSVKGSNMCRIAVHHHKDTGQIIILSVIDNLVKGASGQAVQNMNIMFGLEEDMGLKQVALLP
ncbi:MAG: N-acetyl-gamma-glutamyl-phosphate reductase [Oceanospirillaceae bacterium]|uniref:N-acetyl-gamma-glutamyl-phosphate reductase n=1 Tax=unclassified Thalassolituus TaxID=2624967 RepID=UPI000C46D4B4|nr:MULTISPECIES: N-acetyl-gamma-glutamyl-phosphate reductase [unclassified Thalassolituus]MBL35782.1 N-acetyl-gamma-glutamyl-phosphate reductase [Oceanospirillaceae bacterium]MBS53843.1 N-acetyl-gamma-glutamyl-phosphate reductase [Oceanospirillaceae bacterium]